jgi:5'-nucleotidase
MHFLLTNDDGIYAKGLHALYNELSKIAECTIVAPETEQSAVGHAITISRPLIVKQANKNGQFWGHSVAGTPADCVKLGIKALTEKPVDLVVSGINLGANIGTNVIYSGTVSAATEGAILGVPSMAVSLNSHRRGSDFSFAAKFAARMALYMMERNPLRHIPLNINVPALPEEEIKGIVVTSQGSARLVESFERRVDPRENVYYWLAGETQIEVTDKESDGTALKRGMITITPIHYDLTRYDILEDLDKNIQKVFQPETEEMKTKLVHSFNPKIN